MRFSKKVLSAVAKFMKLKQLDHDRYGWICDRHDGLREFSNNDDLLFELKSRLRKKGHFWKSEYSGHTELAALLLAISKMMEDGE
jgi:hypothetical protein